MEDPTPPTPPILPPKNPTTIGNVVKALAAGLVTSIVLSLVLSAMGLGRVGGLITFAAFVLVTWMVNDNLRSPKD